MSDAITERLLDFIRATFPNRLTRGEQLQPSTPLFSSQLIDSMGLVELLVFVDREFGVTLQATMDELMELNTASNLSQHIAELQREPHR